MLPFMIHLHTIIYILMGFYDVAFLPSQDSFPLYFLKIVVEMKAFGPPHVLKLCLVLSKGMLPVKYFHSNKAFFVSVEFHLDHKTLTKLR